ncbi:hypothetical protein KR032_007384, partial [Drosophila birchii]
EELKREQFQKIGNRYYYIENDETKKKTWPSAVAYCRRQNSLLVSLLNEDEWRSLSVKGLNSGRNYWIDLNDRVTEGKFISDSFGRTDPFLKWGDSEPISSLGNEDCVELSSDMKHKMNDVNCYTKNFYVCQ